MILQEYRTVPTAQSQCHCYPQMGSVVRLKRKLQQEEDVDVKSNIGKHLSI